MTDYTLPPVPRPLQAAGYLATALSYGHACAEHVRGPLVEELNLVKANFNRVSKSFRAACEARDEALTRIAELEAQAVTREMTLQDSAVQLLRTNADRDRLRAEVEALRDVERMARVVVAYDWSENDDDAVLDMAALRDSVDNLDAIAKRAAQAQAKGE